MPQHHLMNEDFAAHTPGPWEWRVLEEDGSTMRVLSPGVLIVEQCGGGPWGDSMDRANARLIAAAPTLLAERDEARAQRDALHDALAAIIDDACSYICPSTGREGVPIPHSPRCLAARAALEKARGI